MSRARFIAVLTAIFVASAVSGCKAANTGDTQTGKKKEAVNSVEVVAEVGGDKIMLHELDEMISGAPQQYQAAALSNKGRILDNMINQKLLLREALKQNIKGDAEVKKQIDEATKEILIRGYIKKEIEQGVVISDADAKAYYDANKDKFMEPEKIKVSHILVNSEAEAKDILVGLNGGADFAALAKEKSQCPSKDKGGDLGLLAKGQTVPEFEQVAFSLQPGQLSEVVKTQFGYHIIKVTEKQPAKERSFDEAKEQIKRTILAQRQKERFDVLLKELKDKNKIVIYKDILMPPAENKPAEAPAATGTTTPSN